eukprot:scaffold33213_cov60-Phaeocystis_antarctica.AAC.9
MQRLDGASLRPVRPKRHGQRVEDPEYLNVGMRDLHVLTSHTQRLLPWCQAVLGTKDALHLDAPTRLHVEGARHLEQRCGRGECVVRCQAHGGLWQPQHATAADGDRVRLHVQRAHGRRLRARRPVERQRAAADHDVPEAERLRAHRSGAGEHADVGRRAGPHRRRRRRLVNHAEARIDRLLPW